MGRRKPSPVPVMEWQAAFRLVSKEIAKAARLAAERDPETFNVPNGVNLARWAIVKSLLPELHKFLAEHPGIETPDEIKRYIRELVMSLDPRKVAEYYLAARPSWTKYVDVNRLAKMVAETIDAFRIVVGAATPAAATAAAAPVAA